MAGKAMVVASDDKTLPKEYVGPLEPNYYCRGWNQKRQKYCGSRAGANTDHVRVGRCNKHGGSATNLSSGRYSKLQHVRLRELFDQFAQDPDPLNLEHEVAMLRAIFTDFIERHGVFTDALLAWHASFEATQRPLPQDKIAAFGNVVDEWEDQLRQMNGKASEKQLAEIETARAFVNLLRGTGALATKPRKVLDIADAHRIVETLSKTVERIEKVRAANAISRKDFFRLTDAMGRVLMKVVTDPEQLKKIRDGWLEIAIS